MYLSARYFSSEELVTLRKSWPEMCENDSSSNSLKVSNTQLGSKTLCDHQFNLTTKTFRRLPHLYHRNRKLVNYFICDWPTRGSPGCLLFSKPTGYPGIWSLYWKCNILLFYFMRTSIIAILCCVLIQFNWVQRGRCTALTPRSLFIPCNCTLSKMLKVTADSIRCYSRK